MPTGNQSAAQEVNRDCRGSRSRFRTIANILAALLFGAIALALILPVIQTTGRRPRSRAWRNLRQISLSLANYQSKHGSFPYDSRGADYALYLLYTDAQAGGWTFDATFFDAHPLDRPGPQARWDHAARRIIDSDFDYWNNPDPDGMLVKRLSGCPTVLVLQRPAHGDKWLMFSMTDARISSCGIPGGDYRTLFGSVQDRGGFLVANRKLFEEWEQVQLPSGPGYSSVSVDNHLDHEISGDARILYEYAGDHLARRIWSAPAGTITELVTTDEIGRITGFTREPAEWRSFWPWQRKHDDL